MPTFTGLPTFVGLSGGLYSFTTPTAGPAIFGVVPLSSVMPKEAATTKSIPSPSWAALRAYIRVYGIRNFSSGLAGVGLSLYALFGTTTPAGASVVRRCLGVMMLVGVPLAVGDGWLVGNYAKAIKDGAKGDDEKEAKKAVKVAEGQSTGHYWTSLFIAAVAVGCFVS